MRFPHAAHSVSSATMTRRARTSRSAARILTDLCDRHVVGKERESDIAVNPVVVGVDQLERRRAQWRGAGSWP